MNASEWVNPVHLQNEGVQLEPLTLDHESALIAAATDGQLWHLTVTSVPEPAQMRAYLEKALSMQAQSTRTPFAVRDSTSGQVVGCTSYHDILPAEKRLEIGYTWYAKRVQRTHVNTCAKLLLMSHAFDTLGARVVGWRTDHLNLISQRAIERLGAQRDGVLRGHLMRRDGTVRDTVMYSMTVAEWPPARERLVSAAKLVWQVNAS